MPRTHYAALEQGECRLNCVRGHTQTAFVPDVFIGAVIHTLVLCATVRRGLKIVEPDSSVMMTSINGLADFLIWRAIEVFKTGKETETADARIPRI
jgi:hypothetical protein